MRTDDNGAWDAPYKTATRFDLNLPDWKIGMARMLSEVLEKS
jgi:hypothetical protein